MISFQQYLENKGFRSCRAIFKKNNIEFVSHSECGISEYSFSTMISGGLTIEYIKGDIRISWGIEELGKAPTLLYPLIKHNNKNNLDSKQDIHSRLLKKYSNDEIFESIFCDKILEL